MSTLGFLLAVLLAATLLVAAFAAGWLLAIGSMEWFVRNHTGKTLKNLLKENAK